MAELPTGTMTFLFTDVEGSTRLLDELGAEWYAEALAEHRSLLREAVARYGGVEVDTQGDAFFFVFADPAAALAAADEGQRALEATPVSVRMGVHTGQAMRAGHGYVGFDVHKGARVAAAGHGGQVVVSEPARLASRRELQPLGTHRLKDLGAPEPLWQLGNGDFPRLKSLNQTNLPVQPSPLIGRERELSEVGALLRDHRVVTLVGPGGSGKTRLALQLAAEAVDEFPHGVWWVPLQALHDAALVVPTVASTLGVKGELLDHLAGKRLLLLLDNMEQLVDAAAELAELLASASDLRLLATSREPIRIAGEVEYAVEPLAEDDAVALFRERATVGDPLDAVAAICRRLDHLPLAIELAAARTKLLPPEQLLGRLERRLPLLSGGRRDAPERQRTLRATIEWSYELLSDEEKQLFARLAVFAGSFDLDAAEQICDADVETLQSLLDKSLIRR
ncbi:MAG: adenylate/guanylate cyclase domain-containing protein, partial [Actinomycetota bacterium]|nr:adenylate/guanylate cyclase domain-containing protein [Actinomycetota bacterium]